MGKHPHEHTHRYTPHTCTLIYHTTPTCNTHQIHTLSHTKYTHTHKIHTHTHTHTHTQTQELLDNENENSMEKEKS